LGTFISGIHITGILAEHADCIPASLSSKTKHSSGFSESFSQAFKKISGFGLPFSTSLPNTNSSKYPIMLCCFNIVHALSLNQ